MKALLLKIVEIHVEKAEMLIMSNVCFCHDVLRIRLFQMRQNVSVGGKYLKILKCGPNKLAIMDIHFF